MNPLYNFGLSQEDPITGIKGLDLTHGDSLLCIAGAGDVPLCTVALKNVSIVAVDTSENQLRLCRIKQLAATLAEPGEAAGFLGYSQMACTSREALFHETIASSLTKEDQDFWRNNVETVRNGVIHAGKFEQFIGKASFPGLLLIGKRNFYRLFDCSSLAGQEEVFDRFFAGILLKTIFKSAFHPLVYKNRGIDAVGLQHHQKGNIGDLFFKRFRSFCCSTPARDNFLLQYVFFRQSLFPGALPEYLKPENHATFLINQHQISFISSRMETFISQAPVGQFNKILLSNIGDWMSKEAMAGLFMQIQEKTNPGSRTLLRYIYLAHPIPRSTPFLQADQAFGEELLTTDRFPFSSILPIQHLPHA